MKWVIRRPETEDLPALRQLWKIAFDDDDQTVDFLLEELEPARHALTLWDGDVLVSMLFLLPSLLSLQGASYDAEYLYAAATAPEYRGQGRFRQLEAEAVHFSRLAGAAAMVLVPGSKELFSFYESLGYRTRFYRGIARVAPQSRPLGELCGCSENDFLTMRRNMLRKRTASFDFYPSGAALRYREFLHSGGEILRYRGVENGYLAGRAVQGEYQIAESSLGTAGLSHAAGLLLARPEITRVSCTGSTGTSVPYGMIKLLDDRLRYEQIAAAMPYMNLMLD